MSDLGHNPLSIDPQTGGRPLPTEEKERVYRPPSVFSEAWDEMKEPLGIFVIFIMTIVIIVGTVVGSIWFGHAMSVLLYGGKGLGISIAIATIFVVGLIYWYIILVISKWADRT